MTKKSVRILAMILVVMLLATGCSLIVQKTTEDKPVDGSTVVAEFTGGKILASQVMDEYQSVEDYYASYDYPLDDPATIKSIKSDIIDNLSADAIVRAKAEQLGYTTVTDADRAAFEEKAKAEYEDIISYYSTYFEGNTDEEVRAQVEDFLKEQGYSVEEATQYLIDQSWQGKLYDEATKGAAVSDADIQAAYDERVAADKETYESDRYGFEYATMSGETMTWVPEGYRAVKHILLPFTEEQVAALTDLSVAAEDLQYQIDEIDYAAENPDEDVDTNMTVEPETDAATAPEADAASADATAAPEADAAASADASVTAAPDAALVESDGEVKQAAEPTAVPDAQAEPAQDEPAQDAQAEPAPEEAPAKSREELVAELSAKKAELKKLEDEYALTLSAKVAEVQGKIAAGEDFVQLIEQYGDDPGMTEEPGLTKGYYVCATTELYEKAFTDAAMALQKVGDVSEPVVGTNGIHIIRYMNDVTPGAVPLEEIRASIEASALEKIKTDLYEGAKEQWITEAKLVTYPERLG
ncbi:MAG: peptidylprolyl isomerase [Clostridia bacterium]